MDEVAVEHGEAAAFLGQHFHDELVGVDLGEVLRNLALADRVIQRVVDHLGLNAEAGSGVAVDGDHRGGPAGLLVGRDIAQLGQRFQLAQNPGCPGIEFAHIGVLQGILILGF